MEPNLLTTIDQMSQEVSCSFPPKRVISLVPSQTELLLDLGVDLVGRTKFCIHPKEKVKEIPIIGGTKNFRFEKIKELSPDLIIGNKEENYEEGILELKKDFPVWMSDIYNLDDAFAMMKSLGVLLDKDAQAEKIIERSQRALEKVRGTKSGDVLYMIWNKPYMVAGRNTFIDHILEFLGYRNVVKTSRYPELSIEEIHELNPEYILLSSEPYPFKEKHRTEMERLFPKAKCKLIDGELYSWYGSRLQYWTD